MFASISLPTNLAASESLSWDMAKQIIQSQSNLAMYGITVLVGVTILLMAGTWVRNFYLRRRELERAIESVKSEITSKVEEDFTKLTEGFKDEIGKMREEIEKSVEKRMILFGAEKARLFAFANGQLKVWETAVDWWAEAIVGYDEAEHKELLRTAVDALNGDLDECKKLEDHVKENIKKSLSSIPEILRKERKQIEDKLKKLPKEITKQSKTRSN